MKIYIKSSFGGSICAQVRDFTVDDRNPSTVNRQTVRWSGRSGRVVWRVWEGLAADPCTVNCQTEKKLVHIW